MIVKSRFPWFVGLAVGFGLLCCVSTTVFLMTTVPTIQAKLAIVALGTFSLLIGLVVVWRIGWQIWIDPSAATIRFRNVLSRKEQLFHFDEFDGFVVAYESNKNGKVKVLYLVKNGIFCKKISGQLYANLDELRQALVPLKYFGERKLSIRERIRIMRNLPVFDQ